jgi:hypothetical protein
MNQRITIQMSVERVLPGNISEVEIDLEVSGDVSSGFPGTYIQPSEPPEVEDIIAIGPDGEEIELTERETERATEKLMDAACESACCGRPESDESVQEDWEARD